MQHVAEKHTWVLNEGRDHLVLEKGGVRMLVPIAIYEQHAPSFHIVDADFPDGQLPASPFIHAYPEGVAI